ncbi:MAG: carboxypeptidase-like regulatory domain-containing protein, partial [Candidatus Korobacteraceae bacterium]
MPSTIYVQSQDVRSGFSRQCRRRVLIRSFGMFVFLLVPMVVGWAQTDRGAVRGTIFDPTGAVVAQATLTITNVATGVSSTVTSSDAGTYNFPALPAGTYRIEVRQSGFKNLVRENVAVSAANITGLDISLEVGDTAETVTVTAEAPLLRTESSVTGTEVDAIAYVDLPLTSGGGRRSSGFMLLVPGYSGNRGSFTDSINGAQGCTKEKQLEGASMVTVEIT